MPRLIEDERLQLEFSFQSLTRGLRYFESGRVSRLESADGGRAIVGQVDGTRDDPYEVRLSVERQGEDLRFFGVCSCPVGVWCKHVAAVVAAARDQPGLDVSPDGAEEVPASVTMFHRWVLALEERERHAERRAPAEPPKLKRLVYRVGPARDFSGMDAYLYVEPRAAKVGEDGTLEDVARFDFEVERELPSTNVEVTNDDRLLWFRLTGHGAPNRGGLHASLRSTVEDTALFHELVATGRGYYGPFGVRLRPGPKRTGVIRWGTDDRGFQTLRVFAEDNPDERLHLLPLVPPHYVVTDGRVGPIELPVSQSTAVGLVEVPEIDPVEAYELPESVREALQSRGLPLPAVPNVQRVPKSEAMPCLYVGVHDRRDFGDPFAAVYARVIGDYRGVVVIPGDGEEVEREEEQGEVFELHRDLEAEAGWVKRATELGLELENDGHCLQSDRAPPSGWPQFLRESVAALRAQGWFVKVDPKVPIAPPPDAWYLDVEEREGGWFDLKLGVEVDGEAIDLVPVIVRAIREGKLGKQESAAVGVVAVALPDGRRIALPAERLVKILDVLIELHDERFAEEPLRLARGASGRLAALAGVRWRGGDRLKELAEQLARSDALPVIDPPEALEGTLRDYQARGLDWLGFLRHHGFGGLLADDMGLGKTVQTLAHLLVEKRAGRLDRPCLVVAPRSVIGNWARECARFAPSLSCAVYHGTSRRAVFKMALPDLIVTTYALLRSDEAIQKQSWHVVVLDEAQAIKNPKSRVASAARELVARQRLCLSGTPMENNLDELWSLMTFVCPGLLGTRKQFKGWYRNPIEREGDAARMASLSARIAPFMLRRKKDQVLSELPPKTEILVEIPLEKRQRDLYESVRLTMEKRVRGAMEEQGLAKSQLIVLDALLKLRQVCCHPALVPTETAQTSGAGSAKTERVLELLEELHAEGHRALVFSQFTSMLDILSAQLLERGIAHREITGRTKHRERVVDAFQAGEFPVLLVSLKAGGTGINLTNADVVIHYDPWWNPAAEAQATDRAHRIGQTRPVTVYRLVCEGSVEQRMLELQDRKRALTESLQRDAEQRAEGGLSLGEKDIEQLLAPLS